MSDDIVEELRTLRSHEQEAHGYASSSRWYKGTTLAISWLEQGLNASSPAERFRYAWSALYNLYMMTHARGDAENTTMTRWAGEIQNAPKVRRLAAAMPDEFLPALLKAKKALLYDAEKKKSREALAVINGWQQKRAKGQEVSPARACAYLFLIGRDIRNALAHPTLDVNSVNIKKALMLAADIFLPLAVVAIEASIERPPAGTTGRATAYRSFLYPFLKNSDSVFSDYYLERLFPEEELAAFPEGEAKQRLKQLTKAHETRRAALTHADAETTLRDWCEPVLFAELGFAAHAGVRVVTDDGMFEPTRVIARPDLEGSPRAEYTGKEAGRELACLVWVFPWGASLDAVSRDEAFPELTLMEVAQRALARADVEWAILTNGQRLRLLSKRTAHRVRSFLEVDLAAVLDLWTDRDAQLAFRYTLGLFSHDSLTARDARELTRLDRAAQRSAQHGKAISDELKRNVFDALEELGQGFLENLRANPGELEAWRVRRAPSVKASEFPASDELLTDVYHESLSLMYRLLFLFYAESRDLLPMENDAYRESYSLESIRDDIIATHDDPDPKRFFSRGATGLWERLKQLFAAVNGGVGSIIPAYDGGLFDPEQHAFLERFEVSDYYLAQAIDLLSRTKPGAVRGEGRKKVTYRDLDIRHLGSIYEGILEYRAEIAGEEKAVVKRGTGGRVVKEYASLSELTPDERQHLKAYREALAEDEENPPLPKGCKVEGLVEPGEYYLIDGGRESKRKSSGSYYTPDYVVQYIVEKTLGPLVRGEGRPKPAPVPALLRGAEEYEEAAEEARLLTSDEILELKVLDPAMGSGHFLVAATEYLARAYGAACAREGKDPDGVMSDEEFVRYKRMVAERCIYGVDINPMAVELAKLSTWLFTMDRGRPLSFLNHHLKTGNALVGAWIEDLGQPPEVAGDNKPKKRARKDTRTGNLFEVRFREKVPLMVRDLFGIMGQETLTIDDVQLKKTLDQAVEDLRRPFRNLADIWVGLHFGEEADDFNNLLLRVEQANSRTSDAARKAQAFHYELEFPEVFFDKAGRQSGGGFDVVIGNPPYGMVLDERLKSYFGGAYSSTEGRFDTYELSVEKGVRLCKKRGVLGFIVPSPLLSNLYAKKLRQFLLANTLIREISNFGMDVFADPTVHTCIIVLERGQDSRHVTSVRKQVSDAQQLQGNYDYELPQAQLGVNDKATFDIFIGPEDKLIVEKLTKHARPLGDICFIRQCIKTGNDPEYVKSSDNPLGRPWKPSLRGRSISRYVILEKGLYVKYGPWLARNWQNTTFYETPKIAVRETGARITAAIDLENRYFLSSLYAVYPQGEEERNFLFYLLGILNSLLATYFIKKVAFDLTEGAFTKIRTNQLARLPIPTINSSDRRGQAHYAQLVEAVQQVIQLYEQFSSSKGAARRVVEEKINSAEQKIDRLVYRLYDLTEDEITFVEKAVEGESDATAEHR